MLGLARFVAAQARRIADRIDPPKRVWEPTRFVLYRPQPLGPTAKPHRDVLDERGIRDLVRREFAAHRQRIADEMKETP